MRPLPKGKTMTEIILSVHFITDENIEQHKRDLQDTILNSVPGAPVEFEVGKVIVTQTILTPDLFDETFRCTRENIWLATREQLNEKFNIIDDANKTDTFALITKK